MATECVAEFIDGIWETSVCNCTDCLDAEDEEREAQIEMGHVDEDGWF